MPLRIIQITLNHVFHAKIESIIKLSDATLFWEMKDLSDQLVCSIITSVEKSQDFLDSLSKEIGHEGIKKIAVSNVETILPKEKDKKFIFTLTNERAPKEELYQQLSQTCEMNINFILLILLSTIVAALGLINNQIIAVIAAMVIAPMLYTNLAIAFSVVIGDLKLLTKAIKITSIGIGLCLALSIIIGYFWAYNLESSMILFKTSNVGYTSIVLALAAGAAGTISLTSNLSNALVGVMVAVALLPPLVTTGILIGNGSFIYALGSALLFVANIVCVNLSANLIFLLKGMLPKKWEEKEKTKAAIFWYLLFWLIALIGVIFAIYFYHNIQIPSSKN